MHIDELLEVAAPWQALGAPALAVGLSLAPDGHTHKRPLTEHGHLDAVLAGADLRAQLEAGAPRLRDGEELGVGVVPGGAGLFVLDFDAGAGKEGLEVLDELLAVHADLDACSYRSISGGVNVVLAKPDPTVEVGNHSPWTGRGVDVRGDAGWIVAPGVVVSWGSWDWRTGHSPAAAPVAPAAIAEQLRPPGHIGSTPASATEVDDWLDLGGHELDLIDRHWMAGVVTRFEQAVNRNPTMFEILDELVSKYAEPPGRLDRRSVYVVLEQVWVERMLVDNEPHRVEEIAGMLARKVGYYDAQREAAPPDDEPPSDPGYDRDVVTRARTLRIDEDARAFNHSLRIAALGEFEQPLVGLEAVREHLDTAGKRCFWGTGNVILLARGESLILAGKEGTGKTTIALQVVRAALGGDWKVLGHRVDELAADEYVLYLAIDRPRQIQEAMLQVLGTEPGTDRLILWTHGVLRHVQAGRDRFLEWLANVLGADRRLGLIVVDSLKDVIVKLSSDEEAGRWQQIRTALASLDVPVIELHHFKKDDSGAGNDVLFGSALLSAGAGSVLQIHGEATDDTFLLQQTKMPAEGQEPLKVRHVRDDETGWLTEVLGTPRDDFEVAMVAAGEHGFTVGELVAQVVDNRKPDARKKAVQREIDRLLGLGRVVDSGTTRVTGKRRATVYRWATFDAPADTIREDPCPDQNRAPTRDDEAPSSFGTPPKPLSGVLEPAAHSDSACETSGTDDVSGHAAVGLTVAEAVERFGAEAVDELREAGYVIDDEGVIRAPE